MRILIYKWLGIWLAVSALAGVGAANPADVLIPTPKDIRETGLPFVASGTYRLVNWARVPEPRLAWIRQWLECKLGWKECSDSDSDVVSIILKNDSGESSNPEFYTLKTGPVRIVLTAHTPDGMNRALGRLTGILDSPLVTVRPDGTALLPQLTVQDWPDSPVRAVKLEMVDLPGQLKHEQWIPILRDTIDTIASLGFNRIFFEVGGRIQSVKHPEISLPRSFSPRQVRELVEYAENCGLKVCPMINSIGHMKRAPQIFPLYGKDRGGELVPRAMNLGHPEFWRVYMDYLDELLAIFKETDYLMICTDEFHQEVPMLEEATGQAFEHFYPAFLNRVNRFLQGRGVRLMIAHDMLLDRGKYPWPREEGNAPPGANILSAIDRNIAIGYWNYEYGDYPFLDELAAAGFTDLWVMPWYKAEAVKQLSGKGREMGTKLFGAVWWIYPHHQGYPQLSEYFWNAGANPEKDVRYFDDAADRLFYSRGTRRPAVGSSVVVLTGTDDTAPSADFIARLRKAFPDGEANADGIPADFSAPRSFNVPGITPPPEIPRPWNFTELGEQGKLENLLFGIPDSREWFQLRRVRLNQPRGIGETVIYTPAYGESTRTNSIGHEFAVADGKIAELSGRIRDLYSEEKGNMKIPPNGLVVSKHGARFAEINTRISGAFNHALQIGQPVEIRMPSNVELPPVRIGAALNLAKDRLVIWVTTVWPVVRGRKLGEFVLFRPDGKMERLPFSSNAFFNSWSPYSGNWRFWMPWAGLRRYGLMPVLALEWRRPPGRGGQPVKWSLEPTREGVESGLTVLGAVQYDE